MSAPQVGAVCVAIPTYNERDNLPTLLRKLNETFHANRIDGWIIVIDDNSPDGTGVLADELARVIDNVTVIHRPAKSGLGSAYTQAFALALSRQGTSIIAHMDADLSHNPEILPSLLIAIARGSDIVVASRKIPGGGTPDWSFYRRTVSSAANLLARLMLGLRVKDATSGYRAFTRHAIEAIDFRSIGESGFAFQIETLSRARKWDLKVMEVPFVYRERIHGKSKFGRKEVWAYIKTVFRLAFE